MFTIKTGTIVFSVLNEWKTFRYIQPFLIRPFLYTCHFACKIYIPLSWYKLIDETNRQNACYRIWTCIIIIIKYYYYKAPINTFFVTLEVFRNLVCLKPNVKLDITLNITVNVQFREKYVNNLPEPSLVLVSYRIWKDAQR